VLDKVVKIDVLETHDWHDDNRSAVWRQWPMNSTTLNSVRVDHPQHTLVTWHLLHTASNKTKQN